MQAKRPILLDTGPLVALLVRSDRHHQKAKALFASLRHPLITCEAVLSETCFLMAKADPRGPDEVLALARKGLYEIPFQLSATTEAIELLLKKYRTVPISLADACLIQMANQHDTPFIATFDSDFHIYRWGRNKRFQIMPEFGQCR